MDYEKRYNDALKRAEEIMGNDCSSESTKVTCQEIFPELRESEDERIRKHIVKFIDEQYPTHGNLKEEKDKMLAYLEKQKYPNEDYLNNPAFLDGFDTGREVQKIFDEQKPNSTEDVYIADEHFYGQEPVDSFKYKLAEYMTKNYRKVEGPYGHTYAISAETILGMAKEELIKRGELQKPAEWNPNNEDVILFNKAVTTNPNLTPSERAKLDIIRTKFKHCNEIPQEQKPVEWRPYDKEVLTKIKELIDSNFSEHEQREVYKNWLDEHISQPVECIPDSIKFDEGFKTGREVGFREGVESVKPTEWSKNDTVFLNEITDYFENKTVRLQHDIDMYAHWLKSLPERFSIQPKQEWSEEDMTMLNNLIWSVHMKSISPLDEMDDRGKYERYENFLSSLPKRFNLQQAQEWSEEDEKMRNSTLLFVDQHRLTHPLASKCYDWLKSLPLNLRKKNEDVAKLCSNKWSEEDENKIESIKGLITMGRFADANTIWTVWNLLDSLRPSWKPSEEQMNALNFAITYFMHETSYKNPTELRDLYEDLLKLKGGVAPMRDIDK